MEVLDAPIMMLARCRIGEYESVLAEDIPRASEKRIAEHRSARWLLEQMLLAQGYDVGSLEVLRDEHRAPYLSWIAGTWRNEPLPSISISHSMGWAVVALAGPSLWVGIDAEPITRQIQENAFDMMSKGEELDRLRASPDSAIRLWTAKEAVQKAMHLGMNLNPREIVIPIAESESTFSIRNSKIQLKIWADEELNYALAYRSSESPPRTAEDNLLDITRERMSDGFSIGCKTTRGN